MKKDAPRQQASASSSAMPPAQASTRSDAQLLTRPAQTVQSSRQPVPDDEGSGEEEMPEDYEEEFMQDELSVLFGTYFCTEEQQTVAQVLAGIALTLEENTKALSQLTHVQMEYAKSVHQLAKVCAEHIRKP